VLAVYSAHRDRAEDQAAITFGMIKDCRWVRAGEKLAKYAAPSDVRLLINAEVKMVGSNVSVSCRTEERTATRARARCESDFKARERLAIRIHVTD